MTLEYVMIYKYCANQWHLKEKMCLLSFIFSFCDHFIDVPDNLCIAVHNHLFQVQFYNYHPITYIICFNSNALFKVYLSG